MGKLILKISKPSMNNLKVGTRKSKGIGDVCSDLTEWLKSNSLPYVLLVYLFLTLQVLSETHNRYYFKQHNVLYKIICKFTGFIQSNVSSVISFILLTFKILIFHVIFQVL